MYYHCRSFTLSLRIYRVRVRSFLLFAFPLFSSLSTNDIYIHSAPRSKQAIRKFALEAIRLRGRLHVACVNSKDINI